MHLISVDKLLKKLNLPITIQLRLVLHLTFPAWVGSKLRIMVVGQSILAKNIQIHTCANYQLLSVGYLFISNSIARSCCRAIKTIRLVVCPTWLGRQLSEK